MDYNISIIITARNYSKYLSECIESCLNQTIKPIDIIYSDDYSTDNSLEVAEKYNITIVKHSSHVGVVQARNDGVNASKGNVLVHVDGDDTLPPNFLEKHLEVFDENTPFVYCAAQCFGAHNIFWDIPNWCERSLWTRNYVNTSAMIWKDKFLQVGGWKETCKNTMWDWSLFLRLGRLGIPRKSSAILNYRQHGESWSVTKEKESNDLVYINDAVLAYLEGAKVKRYITKEIIDIQNEILKLQNKRTTEINKWETSWVYNDNGKKLTNKELEDLLKEIKNY